jgi:hypothetical protein
MVAAVANHNQPPAVGFLLFGKPFAIEKVHAKFGLEEEFVGRLVDKKVPPGGPVVGVESFPANMEPGVEVTGQGVEGGDNKAKGGPVEPSQKVSGGGQQVDPFTVENIEEPEWVEENAGKEKKNSIGDPENEEKSVDW